MANTGIEAVFGPIPAALDLSEDTRPGNDAAVCLMTGIATLSVILRLVARYVSRAGVKADDWTMVMGLLFVYCTTGQTLAAGAYGAGTHVWSRTLPDVVMVYKIVYTFPFTYAAAVSATKISLLLFYFRIFRKSAGPSFTISLWVGGFLAVSYFVIGYIVMGLACRPVSFFWEQFLGAEGSCPVDIPKFFLGLGIVTMVNDIIILLIPVPQIWKLNMSQKKRLGVIGIMFLGSFVCVASAVRIYVLTVFGKATDVTWTLGPVCIWSSVEPAVAILGGCMPVFPPLIRLAKDRVAKTYGQYGGEISMQRSGVSSGWSARGKEADAAHLVRMHEDEYQLTNYVGTGDRGSDSDYQGQGIMVQSQIQQSSSRS